MMMLMLMMTMTVAVMVIPDGDLYMADCGGDADQ